MTNTPKTYQNPMKGSAKLSVVLGAVKIRLKGPTVFLTRL